jgi:hypothetical protein
MGTAPFDEVSAVETCGANADEDLPFPWLGIGPVDDLNSAVNDQSGSHGTVRSALTVAEESYRESRCLAILKASAFEARETGKEKHKTPGTRDKRRRGVVAWFRRGWI